MLKYLIEEQNSTYLFRGKQFDVEFTDTSFRTLETDTLKDKM